MNKMEITKENGIFFIRGEGGGAGYGGGGFVEGEGLEMEKASL